MHRLKTGVALCLWTCLACQTPQQQGDEPLAYDGILQEMDSLPDCNEETEGSLFWIRSQKSGFECSASHQWEKRGTTEPEDTEYGPQSSLQLDQVFKQL